MTDFHFLLAPGAGAPSAHPRMRAFQILLAAFGPVRTLDYPYMQAGRRRPDPLPKLIEAHRAALADVAEPVILAGKSMGGRVGCHVALEAPVAGLICFGYPLCGAGDPARLRDQVLRDLKTPILFVQGDRDRLCPLDLLDAVRAEMTAPTALHVAAGADHSLIVAKTALKAQGRSQDEVDAGVSDAVSAFLRRLRPG